MPNIKLPVLNVANESINTPIKTPINVMTETKMSFVNEVDIYHKDIKVMRMTTEATIDNIKKICAIILQI